MQQARPQPMLEIRDGLTDRGLRQIQALRGPAETAGIEHRMKATQLVTFNVHGSSISLMSSTVFTLSVYLIGPSLGHYGGCRAFAIACPSATHQGCDAMNAVMEAKVDIKKGLEGVVVDTTSTSLVDGEAGRLYYRGYPIERLVQYPFAAVAHLIIFGELPAESRLREFEEFLWEAGKLPASLTSAITQLSSLGAHPMATLQAAVPLMACEAPRVTLGRSADEQEALVVAARLPTAHALLLALRSGRAPTPYPDARRYGERFLQLVHNRKPSAQAISIFEQIQILQIDHSF